MVAVEPVQHGVGLHAVGEQADDEGLVRGRGQLYLGGGVHGGHFKFDTDRVGFWEQGGKGRVE
ncbi:MAG TPA: hypothetical protein DIW51_05320, partial [Rhodospirillaceae bacterium]|nr:hypothetical protein [Rhodospirillaceae bacterium]